MTFAVIANQLLAIEILARSNYKKWEKDIELLLSIINLDLALLEPKLDAPEKEVM